MIARVRKGDMVKVVAGKHKGRVGRVLKVLPSKNRVIVEGVNVIKKHMKASADREKGEIIEREAPIHLSNVMPVDPATAKWIGTPEESAKVKGTRVGIKVEGDRKVRYARRSGEIIPEPEDWR